MEKIRILDLDVNADGLIDKLSQTKKQIDSLKESNKELKKAGEGSSKEFVKNEAAIKKLSSSYRTQQKAVQTLLDEENKHVKTSQAANNAISKQAITIDELTANNKELKSIRNKLNLEDEEHLAILTKLNSKLDENTAKIKENVGEAEQQKMTIGDYKNQIVDALSEMNPFNGGLVEMAGNADEAGGATSTLTGGMGALTAGLKGVARAAIAFIATPLGATLAIVAVGVTGLVALFGTFKKALERTEGGQAKLNKITSIFSGIMNGVLKVLTPVANFLADTMIATFEDLGNAVVTTIGILEKGLRFAGLDSAADNLNGFTRSIVETSKQTQQLADAEVSLNEARRKQEQTQLKFQRDAEKLRQIRDDESLTIEQRKQANEDLGNLLLKQADTERELANQALVYAKLKAQAEGESKENLDAIAEAQTKLLEIDERVTSQQSEQKMNLNALRNEQKAKAQEAIDAALEQQQAELDLYVAQQGLRSKTLQEELATAREVKDKKLAILDEELKAKKKSQTQYEVEVLGIKNEFAQLQAQATVNEAERELQILRDSLNKRIADETFFTEAKLQEKVHQNDLLAAKEREFQQLQLDQGIINQTQYNDAINLINENNRIANDEARKEREEAENERKAIDLENERALRSEGFLQELDRQQLELEQKKQAELAAAEKTGADKAIIEAKYAQQSKDIEDARSQFKIDTASQTLGSLVTLLGKESKAGKAVAIAQTTIDTYQSATAAYKAMAGIPVVGPALGAIAAAAAVANGLSTVKKITSQKEPALPESTSVPRRAGGGSIPRLSGSRINTGSNLALPLSNGDDTLAYVKQGEVVLNEEQQRRAGGAMFFRSIGVPGYANGGQIGSFNKQIKNVDGIQIDYDKLGVKVGEAFANAPAPRVGVDEISSTQTNVLTIQNGANF